MATSIDFIEYLMEKLSEIKYEFRYRKMFGEYYVYANDKPILLVCDNTVFIKMLPELEDLMKDSETGPPYPSAKDFYILDVENKNTLNYAVEILERNTSIPKSKKKKK